MEPFTSSRKMDCHYPYSSVMNLTCGGPAEEQSCLTFIVLPNAWLDDNLNEQELSNLSVADYLK